MKISEITTLCHYTRTIICVGYYPVFRKGKRLLEKNQNFFFLVGRVMFVSTMGGSLLQDNYNRKT